MTPNPPTLTHTQKVAMMWDAAAHLHEMCEEVDQLFARNCLLFELRALSDDEMLGDVLGKVEPLFSIVDGLEILDLDPEERARVEQKIRETMELIRAQQ